MYQSNKFVAKLSLFGMKKAENSQLPTSFIDTPSVTDTSRSR